jgi:hypothetical protein
MRWQVTDYDYYRQKQMMYAPVPDSISQQSVIGHKED